MSQRKLVAWERAGLIDAATAERIRAWEAEHARPLGLWAVIGLAALTIGLGLVSLIAANWQAIPGTVRLGVHFAAMLGLAIGIGVRRRDGAVVSIRDDAFLFIEGALGLTFLGHLGQVYQTTSPLWEPLALWLALFSPLLLGLGRTWLVASTWMVVFVATCWGFLAHAIEVDPGDHPVLVGLATGLPALVAGSAAWVRTHARTDSLWKRLELAGGTYVVLGAGFSVLLSGVFYGAQDELREALITSGVQSLLALAAAAVVRGTARTETSRAMVLALVAAAIANLLSPFVAKTDVGAALVFLAYVAGLAALALRVRWRAAFQLTIFAAALRIIVLSFELAGDLLGSGIGLILAGSIILVITGVAVRTVKRFAPTVAGR